VTATVERITRGWSALVPSLPATSLTRARSVYVPVAKAGLILKVAVPPLSVLVV